MSFSRCAFGVTPLLAMVIGMVLITIAIIRAISIYLGRSRIECVTGGGVVNDDDDDDDVDDFIDNEQQKITQHLHER